MAGYLFLACSLLYTDISTFPCQLVLSGYFPSSALSTVLLVVLEHLGILFAVVICAVPNCFTSFAFPSHISPAYSIFGTITFYLLITFIRLHLFNPSVKMRVC